MAAILEMLEYHDAHHVADVKRIRSRVYSDICCCRAFHKFFLSARHDLLDHASPFEFLYKIFHIIISVIFLSFHIVSANLYATENYMAPDSPA